ASPIKKRRHEWTSLRRKRRSKHTATVQRGEVGIPRSVQMYLRMFLFNIRRGVSHTPISHTHSKESHTPSDNMSGRKHSAPTVLLLCFLCLFNHALAQPRQNIGTAPGQTVQQIKDTTDTTLAIEEVIVSTG